MGKVKPAAAGLASQRRVWDVCPSARLLWTWLIWFSCGVTCHKYWPQAELQPEAEQFLSSHKILLSTQNTILLCFQTYNYLVINERLVFSCWPSEWVINSPSFTRKSIFSASSQTPDCDSFRVFTRSQWEKKDSRVTVNTFPRCLTLQLGFVQMAFETKWTPLICSAKLPLLHFLFATTSSRMTAWLHLWCLRSEDFPSVTRRREITCFETKEPESSFFEP